MAVDAAGEFVDANVLVYAYDASAGARQEQSMTLLDRLWTEGSGRLSIQVLQEFFVIVTRKVRRPLTVDEASDRLREFSTWKVFCPTADDVLAAVALHKRTKLSFWDAMIVESAAQLGCHTLWTEDLSSDQRIRGVRVRNPFA